MSFKMGALIKGLGLGTNEKTKKQQTKKKDSIKGGFDGTKRKELDTEARHVAKKVKNMTRRMDEEELIKDDLKLKQIEGKDMLDENLWRERQQKSFRAEKNKEWREENEWREREEILMAELVCPVCGEEMLPPRQIYQCGIGHVLCQDCVGKDGPKVCIQGCGPITGRNIALEKVSLAIFGIDV
eukprot:GFUD01025673.1.p1 GENE.GFUD01025673.1~~GFUD01025673.1.p1  ORF type:complete len:184 (+),score=66.20 GFUD01025673.1:65-616(+)